MPSSSIKPADGYGCIAEWGLDPVLQAGRFDFQAAAESRIIWDVVSKTSPKADDRLLDIGAGAGLVTIPLSFMVREVVAMDDPRVIARLRSRYCDNKISFLEGNFPERLPEGSFDIIVAYSVLQYMPDISAVTQFALDAARLLAPGGRLLLGDLPNKDAKIRLAQSRDAEHHAQEWKEELRRSQTDFALRKSLDEALSTVPAQGVFSDKELCDLLLALRSAGFVAYIAPQPHNLPFGLTREDILVRRF